MKDLLKSVALLLLLVGPPAYAFQCPVDVAAIDAALKAKAQALSADVLAEAKALRDKGEAFHRAGKHGDAVATLAKAKAMLGIR